MNIAPSNASIAKNLPILECWGSAAFAKLFANTRKVQYPSLKSVVSGSNILRSDFRRIHRLNFTGFGILKGELERAASILVVRLEGVFF